MDILDEDLLILFKNFYTVELKYIVIGGFAVNLHGHSRFTADIDIWIEEGSDNRGKLRQALCNAGLGDFEMLETIPLVPGYSTIMLDSGLELDIMAQIAGFEKENFMECYAVANVLYLDKLPVPFLHLNHLIHAKKASNRPQDLLDLEALNKLHNPKPE